MCPEYNTIKSHIIKPNNSSLGVVVLGVETKVKPLFLSQIDSGLVFFSSSCYLQSVTNLCQENGLNNELEERKCIVIVLHFSGPFILTQLYK